MRKAFSMLVAISVILVMSTVAVLILGISGKTIGETTTQFKREQAILYAKSYTELAVMRATAVGCPARIRVWVGGTPAAVSGTPAQVRRAVQRGDGYLVDVRVRFIGVAPLAACNTGGNVIGRIIGMNNLSSQGALIMIDTRVRYRDTDLTYTLRSEGTAVTTMGAAPWVTYFRRTYQRL